MHSPTAEQVDVLAIARLALEPPLGVTPDEVITRELTAAGLTGGYRSLEFRRLHHLCCDARADLKARIREERGRSLSAADLWAAYGGGLSSHRIARKLGLLQSDVSDRSCELGFVLGRDPANGARWIVLSGPCVRCGEALPSGDLDEGRRCRGCAVEED